MSTINPFFRLPSLIFYLMIGLIFFGYVNAGMALLAGMILAITLGNPVREHTQKWTGKLLKFSVVGLGFGLNLQTLWLTTQQGFGLTVMTIFSALAMGLLLGKIFGVSGNLSKLIATGTAICGGSAIAAMSPTIKASQEETAIAISVVFILNAVALYAFPFVGHYLHLTQQQFGLWAALGIHDTSSVVGAASVYGKEALSIATTTKLARALWIIPLVLIASWQMARKEHHAVKAKISLPVFILYFIAASALTTFIPWVRIHLAPTLVYLAKSGLVISLLFMGAGFTRATIRTLSIKPMMQAILLWIFLATGSLTAILMF